MYSNTVWRAREAGPSRDCGELGVPRKCKVKKVLEGRGKLEEGVGGRIWVGLAWFWYFFWGFWG